MKFIVKTMPWAGPVIDNAPTTGIASLHFVTTFQKGVSVVMCAGSTMTMDG